LEWSAVGSGDRDDARDDDRRERPVSAADATVADVNDRFQVDRVRRQLGERLARNPRVLRAACDGRHLTVGRGRDRKGRIQRVETKAPGIVQQPPPVSRYRLPALTGVGAPAAWTR